jgi:hypothetical protein
MNKSSKNILNCERLNIFEELIEDLIYARMKNNEALESKTKASIANLKKKILSKKQELEKDPNKERFFVCLSIL